MPASCSRRARVSLRKAGRIRSSRGVRSGQHPSLLPAMGGSHAPRVDLRDVLGSGSFSHVKMFITAALERVPSVVVICVCVPAPYARARTAAGTRLAAEAPATRAAVRPRRCSTKSALASTNEKQAAATGLRPQEYGRAQQLWPWLPAAACTEASCTHFGVWVVRTSLGCGHCASGRGDIERANKACLAIVPFALARRGATGQGALAYPFN
jgi:hypothetical protein